MAFFKSWCDGFSQKRLRKKPIRNVVGILDLWSQSCQNAIPDNIWSERTSDKSLTTCSDNGNRQITTVARHAMVGVECRASVSAGLMVMWGAARAQARGRCSAIVVEGGVQEYQLP
jgi:hypothetical protein